MAKESDRPNTSPIVHPPVVTLAFLLIAYALGRFVPIPFAVPAMLRYIGLAFAFVGFSADFHQAGNAGHINVHSGHGPWPEGLLMFTRLMQRL